MQALDADIVSYINKMMTNQLTSEQEVATLAEFMQQDHVFVEAVFRVIQQFPQYT